MSRLLEKFCLQSNKIQILHKECIDQSAIQHEVIKSITKTIPKKKDMHIIVLESVRLNT